MGEKKAAKENLNKDEQKTIAYFGEAGVRH